MLIFTFELFVEISSLIVSNMFSPNIPLKNNPEGKFKSQLILDATGGATTLSIATFNIKGLFETLSTSVFDHNADCRYAEPHWFLKLK